MVLALANTAKKRRPLRQGAQSERAHLSLSLSPARAFSLSLSLSLARSSGQILLLSPVDTAGNTRIASRMDCWKSLLRDYPFISFHFRPVTQSRLHPSIHPSMCPDGLFWFGQNADPGVDPATVGTQWRGFSQQCPNRWVTLLTRQTL